MSTKAVFSTVIRGTTVCGSEDLEKAIRAWDHATYDKAHVVEGGIEVREYDGPVMVREGWLLHVNADGVVYLNPNLRLA